MATNARLLTMLTTTLVMLLVVVLVMHTMWTLTPKTDFSLLQASSEDFDCAICSQRRPVVLDMTHSSQPESTTIDALCRGHYWSRSGEYLLSPSKTPVIIRNMHKYMWLFSSLPSKSDPLRVHLYSPSSTENEKERPFIDIIMRPNYALMVPRSWMFSVHGGGGGLSMFFMDDLLTAIVNWCCMFQTSASSIQNL